ncbi:unnamed protein product [Rangifer tarandus platyrhynchus]|uniref:Uncharacterized protein n=1 Tax=Rangifer tarandus platyrhynchus TaxID=3082113 RepID=A0AC59YIX9_RANTA
METPSRCRPGGDIASSGERRGNSQDFPTGVRRGTLNCGGQPANFEAALSVLPLYTSPQD